MDLQIKYENEIKPKIDKTDIFIQEELISGKINKLNDEIKQLQKISKLKLKKLRLNILYYLVILINT